MIKKTKYLLTWVLILLLTLGQFTVYAKDYSDIKTSWAKKEIEKWSKTGVLQGSEGLFRPNDYITRAEMAVILDRIMDYQVKAEITFNDLDDCWYMDAILKNNGAGIMIGNGVFIRPVDIITRQEAVVMLARALNIESTSGQTSFNDDNQMASWSKGYILALNKLGIINGNPDGSFAPSAPITRAETVKMMDNAIKGFYNEEGSYSEDVKGLVIVNTADVVLEDMTIDGDLIIAEGVAEGEVTLNNVNITGDCYIKGGGENSIIFNSVTVEGGLVVNKHDGKIRIVASGNTKVDVTILESGAILLEKELIGGGFQKVEIPVEVAKESEFVLSGNFSTVEVNASEVSIDVAIGAKINTLDFSSSAVGSEVSGKGKVTTVKAGANDLAIDVSSSRIDIAEGIEGVTKHGKPTDGNTSNDSSNDDSSGSSSGGNTPTTINVTNISIDQGEEITLYPSQTSTLTATVDPSNATNKNIVWSTTSAAITLDSNTGEVTVANYVTSAVVTITATALGGTNVKDTIVINIIPEQLHSIIQPSDITVVKGTTMAAINFPQAVEIVLDSERTLDIDISDAHWTTAQGITYEPTVLGSYKFVSTLELPDEITNGNAIPLDITVNVVVERVKHTVTFITPEGANPVRTQVVFDGECALEPLPPEKYGSRVNYWYISDENTPYDFNSPVTGDLVLSSKWWNGLDSNYRDSRFAEGYPKMVVNSDNKIELIIKMASAEPTRVYTTLNPYGSYYGYRTVESVMHGHTESWCGTTYNNYIDIIDTQEHTFKTSVSEDDSLFFYSAFVIDQNDIISEDVTILTMAKEIVAGPWRKAPYIDYIYVSEASNKIYMYVNKMDRSKSHAEPSDFTVTGVEGVEVKSVSIGSEDIYHINGKYNSYYSSRDRIILSVTGLDEYKDLSKLQINYTGSGIHDGSVYKTVLDTSLYRDRFSLYTDTAQPITSILYSKNKDRIKLDFNKNFIKDGYLIDIKYGLNKETATNCKISDINWFLKEYELDNPPTGEGEFFINISGYTLTSDEITITDDENTIKTEVGPFGISKAVYNISDDILLITTENAKFYTAVSSGCDFKISVNGVESIPYGYSSSSSESSDTLTFDNIGIDIHQGDTVKIKFDSEHSTPNAIGEIMPPTDWIPVNIINE